jgi:Flp pilus assembly CpaF family ATPase
VDSGRFAESVAALRQDWPLSRPQIDAVIDTIVRAREAGATMVCLDPTAPPNVRIPAFSAIIRPAIARGAIPDLTLSDERTLQALYDATLGWGPAIQRLLDDPGVTEVKINGTTALASSDRGLIVVPDAFSTVDEPRSRIRALAQLRNVTWDATHPSVTIPLSNKTRLHATRAPLVPDGDLLIVIRRGRSRPWSFDDLVEHGALSEEAAAVVTTLVQARLSLIVSGAQDAGKTTFLECTLNALPPHEHIVLVEDNTDEFCLRSRSVTRLQVHRTSGASAFDIVVRETLRMTPSFLVPGEVRGAEAGAVLQIAEAGRPTATTIHARFKEAALQRFARLAASDVPGNSFARQSQAALRVIAESFHLIVHMLFSRRLQRRIVQSVALLSGLDAQGEPVLLPMIEAQFDPTIAGGVRWRCAADAVHQQLLWRDATHTTPAAVAALLADVPAEEGQQVVPAVAAEHKMADVLARARELLPYPDQASQVIQYLELAYQLDPQHREIWPLAERLLASNLALRESAAAALDVQLQRLEAALVARDLAAVRAAVNVENAPLLDQVALNQHPQWQEARGAGMAFIDQAHALEAALAAAYTIATQQQDYAQALRLLERFHAPSLPRDAARQLLEARIGLLNAQRQLLGPTGSAAVLQHLGLAEQQRAALDNETDQTAPATPRLSFQPPNAPSTFSEAPLAPDRYRAPTAPQHDQVPGQSRQEESLEAELMALGDATLRIAAAHQPSTPASEHATARTPESSSDHIEATSDDDRSTLTPPVTTHTSDAEVGTVGGAGASAEPIDLLDTPMGIRTRSAPEVGNWRQLWQQVTAPSPSEGDDDTDNS